MARTASSYKAEQQILVFICMCGFVHLRVWFCACDLQAIAHLSGSCFFDLSPRNTDGTYPGKAVAMLLHLVFKVGLSPRCLVAIAAKDVACECQCTHSQPLAASHFAACRPPGLLSEAAFLVDQRRG